jgi:hypothetical protein
MAKNVSRSSAATKYLHPAAFLVLIAGAFGLANTVQAADVRHQEGEHLKPTGRGTGEQDPSGLTEQHALRFGPLSTNGISYHGGPVVLGTVNLYYIWYGNWDFSSDATEDSKTKAILNTFGIQIGGTPYFNINATYYDATNTAVSGAVGFPATNNLTVPPSLGPALSDAAVQDIVTNALTGNHLPTDPNGVYFVLTSKDVTETSGFCTQYCAWHNFGTINNQNIKFGFVGNPMRCPAACSAQANTPNGNQAADAMANLIGHELAEATTDPNLNAWFDRSGQENADKCAWTFGSTKPGPNGSRYNVTFGGLNWLLQRNWINKSGGFCTLTR